MCWTPLRYFQEDEFMPGASKSSKEIRFLIDDIRQALGVPVSINCCWAAKGHALKSYHYTGQAIDFHLTGLDFKTQYGIISSFRAIGGLGFYPTWNNPGWHIDTRPGAQRLEWLCINGIYTYGPHVIDDFLYINAKE